MYLVFEKAFISARGHTTCPKESQIQNLDFKRRMPQLPRKQFHFRYFRNPCDRDPPTGNFKNSKFFENSLKILNVYFWGTNVDFWG